MAEKDDLVSEALEAWNSSGEPEFSILLQLWKGLKAQPPISSHLPAIGVDLYPSYTCAVAASSWLEDRSKGFGVHRLRCERQAGIAVAGGSRGRGPINGSIAGYLQTGARGNSRNAISGPLVPGVGCQILPDWKRYSPGCRINVGRQ